MRKQDLDVLITILESLVNVRELEIYNDELETKFILPNSGLRFHLINSKINF
jgi:hypothetical protein